MTPRKKSWVKGPIEMSSDHFKRSLENNWGKFVLRGDLTRAFASTGRKLSVGAFRCYGNAERQEIEGKEG